MALGCEFNAKSGSDIGNPLEVMVLAEMLSTLGGKRILKSSRADLNRLLESKTVQLLSFLNNDRACVLFTIDRTSCRPILDILVLLTAHQTASAESNGQFRLNEQLDDECNSG